MPSAFINIYMANVSVVKHTGSSKHFFVPGISPEVAAYVGHFERGPVNYPIYITSVQEFKFLFGRATESFHNDWYQVYNYLQYSSGIYVVRASGLDNYNANNGSEEKLLTINQYSDWKNQEDTISTSGISIIAKTPGIWANTLSVAIISKSEYDGNTHVAFGNYPKDLFNYFEDGYFGICVFKSDELVEVHYKKIDEFIDLNEESIYIYNKIGPETDYSILSSSITFFDDNILTFSNGFNSYPTDTDYKRAYETLEDIETYDIDIIIGNQINNQYSIDLAEKRKDCIAFIGLPSKFSTFLEVESEEYVLNTEDGCAILLGSTMFSGKINNVIFKEIREYIESLDKSEYVHFTCNIKRQYNHYTNSDKAVNIAGDIAGLKSKVSASGTWQPSAGLENGRIKNSKELLFKFSSAQKDDLYVLGANIAQNNSLITQKTFITAESTFGRVHIRSLFNHIIKEAKKIFRHFLFLENDYFLRDNIGTSLKLYLEKIKVERGIEHAKLYVSPEENYVSVEVFIKPKYTTEYITLKITNVGNNDIQTYIS